MKEQQRIYIAIDLKSFFASVECRERGLDPLKTNLVVADVQRTEKTICLAVTPSLKKYGIPGRARLFEVVEKLRQVNIERKQHAPGKKLERYSIDAEELEQDLTLGVGYLAAPPRMATYMEYSTRIYHIYLRFFAPEDIHVYSIDEVMIDVTPYLETYGLQPKELAEKVIHTIYEETGITATAGIGTNLYLCKVAMDIMAKHVKPDEHGVRIAKLDEMSYRQQLWNHKPLTDFWRVGRGYAARLKQIGIETMGDIARCSIGKENDYYNEELLYKIFGVNAELLIDHAWGWEPCTIAQIKKYKPQNNSIGMGQVLQCAYDYEKTKIVVREMADQLVLDLVEKGLVTDQLVLTIGYDIENLMNPEIRKKYKGEVVKDQYGRSIPKHAHGTKNLPNQTSSTRLIMDAIMQLYEEITNRHLLVRRINLTANKVNVEKKEEKVSYEQMNLFTDYEEKEKTLQEEKKRLEKEKKMQHAVLDIKKKYGKNAIVKGIDLEEGATAMQRNGQIGGHKA